MNAGTLAGQSTENRTIISVPAVKNHLTIIGKVLREIMREAGFSRHAMSVMELSIIEHCENIVKHGRGVERGNIVVNVMTEPPIARVVVEDQMDEFDMLEELAKDKKGRRPTEKLGLRTIMKMCDYVEYAREGMYNYNTFIVKDRNPGKKGARAGAEKPVRLNTQHIKEE